MRLWKTKWIIRRDKDAISFNDLDDTDKLCIVLSGISSCHTYVTLNKDCLSLFFFGPNLVPTGLLGFSSTLFFAMGEGSGITVINHFWNSSAPLYLYCVRWIRHINKGSILSSLLITNQVIIARGTLFFYSFDWS